MPSMKSNDTSWALGHPMPENEAEPEKVGAAKGGTGAPNIRPVGPHGSIDSTGDVLPGENTAPAGCVIDITDITDFSALTNAAFLEAIFGVPMDGGLPIVTGFPGDPRSSYKAKWFGRPWIADSTSTADPELNWYFSQSTFSLGPDEKYRRTKAQFTAIHVIVLDDVNTKALGLERVAAFPPSYVIETSPQNYQVGFILADPVSDVPAVNAVVKALIDARLSDPGADGPITRYARMPVGINAKHTPPFNCRLVQWNPTNRYTLDEIVAGLDLTVIAPKFGPPKRLQLGGQGSTTKADREDQEVYTPRPTDNAVIAALQQRGLYKSALGSGKHELTCPWVLEHTDAIDHGTAYFEPDDNYPKGGFNCFHGHCNTRHIGTLLEHLGISAQMAKHKPIIRIVPGEMNRVVDRAEYELAQAGWYFQRGGMIVIVRTDPGSRNTVIAPLSQSSLLRGLSRVMLWQRFDKKAQAFIACDPPPQHNAVLFNSEHYPHLPVLNGITRQPYLRQDGSLMTCSGYDAASGMFGVFDKAEFSLPAQPTPEQARAALAALNGLLDEFAFAATHDRSAALAGILTAAIRPSLAQAPMFHIGAAEIGSGKSYLASLIVAFANPAPASVLSFPQEDEECRKLLLALLMPGASVVFFDNLTSDLIPHNSLCSALTEPFITGRILGISKTASVDTRALFISTGNNVEAVRDMSRRCISIRLDPACEKPSTRAFSASPVAEVHAKRGHFVSLALTVVLGWIAAGRPQALVCRPLGNYGHWTEMVRQPLLWMGQADPATSAFAGMTADPDRESLGRLLRVWHTMFGTSPKMVRELVRDASESFLSSSEKDLRDVLEEIAGNRYGIDRRRLGRWLAKKKGVIVEGLRLEKTLASLNADQWRVIPVTSLTSVDFPATPQSSGASRTDGAPPWADVAAEAS